MIENLGARDVILEEVFWGFLGICLCGWLVVRFWDEGARFRGF